MKKTTTILLVCILAAFTSFSQPTTRINYQSVARNSSGTILSNQPLGIRISILNSFSLPQYVETHTPTTNQFGLFTLPIGGGTLVSGNYSTIDWTSGGQKLKVEMDPTGGNSYTDMGTSDLLSVPYALSAISSLDNHWYKTGNDLFNNTSGNVGIGTVTPNGKLSVYETGADNAGFFQISNINNVNNAVSAVTNGGGAAVYGTSTGPGLAVVGYVTGTGIAGFFQNNNSTTPYSALYVTSNGTAASAYFDNTGSGLAIRVGSGSVSIGAASPQQLLDVNGGIHIGDATYAAPGSIRYHNNNFEGYDGTAWQSFTTNKYQILNNYSLSFTQRNTMVFGPDSIIVNESGTYFVLLNVRGTNGATYTVPTINYDTQSEAGVYKVGYGAFTPAASLFEWISDAGSAVSYYRYVSQGSSVSTFIYLTAGDVLKLYAYITATGNPTGTWGINSYTIQILKVSN